MGKYNINYRCGHEERIELFGKEIERQNKIKWLESGICKECWKREKIKEEQLISYYEYKLKMEDDYGKKD